MLWQTWKIQRSEGISPKIIRYWLIKYSKEILLVRKKVAEKKVALLTRLPYNFSVSKILFQPVLALSLILLTSIYGMFVRSRYNVDFNLFKRLYKLRI